MRTWHNPIDEGFRQGAQTESPLIMYTSDEEPVRKHHHFMPLRQVQPKVLAPLPRQSDNLETAPPTEAQIKEQQRHEKLIKSRVSSQKWREKKKRLAAEPRTAARAAVTTVARTHLHHSMAYSDEDIEELPQDCHHYRHVGEVPWDIQKWVHCIPRSTHSLTFIRYWQQRHSIFTKYDEGIWMTDDAWFGVTPEPVAKYVSVCQILQYPAKSSPVSKIAKHISSAARAGETVLIDTFAGAGGNVIAFARHGRWQRICAIEKDPQLLRCARHNARIYGVEDKIEWFEGDCFEVLLDHFHSPLTQHSVVFASPPWGGM